MIDNITLPGNISNSAVFVFYYSPGVAINVTVEATDGGEGEMQFHAPKPLGKYHFI